MTVLATAVCVLDEPTSESQELKPTVESTHDLQLTGQFRCGINPTHTQTQRGFPAVLELQLEDVDHPALPRAVVSATITGHAAIGTDRWIEQHTKGRFIVDPATRRARATLSLHNLDLALAARALVNVEVSLP